MKASIKNTKTAEIKEVNWNAKYYIDRALREKAIIDSLGGSSSPVKAKATKADYERVCQAASKVRTNPVKPIESVSKYVMINGVPHKMKDGVLVPLTVKSK